MSWALADAAAEVGLGLTLLPVLCRVVPGVRCQEAGWHWLPLAEAADAGVPTPIRKLIRRVASAAG